MINAIFRSAHTIKGSSRMLKLMPISDAAHLVEDVRGALREGELSYTDALGQVFATGGGCDCRASRAGSRGSELLAPDPVLSAELARAALRAVVRAAEDGDSQENTTELPESSEVPGSVVAASADSTTQSAEIRLAPPNRYPAGQAR